TQGEAFGGAKGEPEDAEMRCARRVIQVCSVGKVAISLVVLRGGQGHGDVAGSLVDRGRPAERARAEAAQRRALVDGDRGDPHLVTDKVMVVLRVCSGG